MTLDHFDYQDREADEQRREQAAEQRERFEPAPITDSVRSYHSRAREIKTMDLRQFSLANRERCEAASGFNHQLHSWSTSDWFTAVVGELGEAANVAKKLNRVRDGITGNDESPDELRLNLGRELADTFIYLDLLAQSVGVNLSDVVPSVFNAKSEKIGYGKLFIESCSDY